MPEKKSKSKKEQSHKVFLSKEFYSDLTRQNMLFAKLVRSPQKNIRISNIDLSLLPENYYFFTSRDIPGKNLVQTLNTKTKIFCEDFVSYVGEPIGILVGENKDEVENLSELISMSFLQKEENISNFKSELLFSRTVKTGTFSEEQKSESEQTPPQEELKTVSSTWTFQEQSFDFNETSGAFCYTEGQTLNVMTPTKWPFHLKQNLCEVLNIPEENIIIKKTQIQNSNFNGTWKISILAIQTALAALKLGRPVKLILSKKEQKLYIENKIKFCIKHESQISKENKIVSEKIFISADAGFQNPYAKEYLDRIVLSSISVYNPKNIFIDARIITSQNPPTSIYPETIDAGGYQAIESHLQKIATELKILPQEVRQINIQDTKSVLYSPFNYKIQKKISIFEPILKQSNFSRKYASSLLENRYLLSTENSTFSSLTRKGIGLSFSPNGSSYFGSSEFDTKQTLETTLALDGTFTIHSHIPSPTISEIWKQTASKILDISHDNIKIINEFPDDEIPDLPENVYSNISVMTQLLRKCCLDIQKKRFNLPLPIHTEKSISPAMKKNWNNLKFQGQPFYSTSFGGAILELELNPLTLSIKITGLYISIDCGEILSLKHAENSIRLEIQRELKFLLKDCPLYCENINIIFVESSSNPSQINEIIHNLIPPAFANALSVLLNTQIESLPISTEQIFSILNESKKSLNETKNQENQISESENKENKNSENTNEIQASISEIQKVIEKIEEEKQENLETTEELQKKAQEISKADEEAIKFLMEKDSKSEEEQNSTEQNQKEGEK